MMFWLGLIVGMFVGVFFGVFLLALCNAASWADRSLDVDESEE
jgi:uncharacterized protein involved in exopolysaccharide biosynthesis